MYNSAEHLLTRKSDPTAGRQPSPALRAAARITLSDPTVQRLNGSTRPKDTSRHGTTRFKSLSRPCATLRNRNPILSDPKFALSLRCLCSLRWCLYSFHRTTQLHTARHASSEYLAALNAQRSTCKPFP